jgi:alpha-mannosidase
VPDVPAFGGKTLVIQPSEPRQTEIEGWKIRHRYIESPFFRLRFDSKGLLTSLYDKRLRRELIKKGARGNLLQTYTDTPKQWEAWDIDAEYASKPTHNLKFKSAKLVEHSQLRVVLRVEYRTSGNSRITQEMMLYHALPRIDFTVHARWFEQQTLLKVAFPFDIRSFTPSYEIPFGVTGRTSKPSAPEDKAKFEVPAQRWADLSDAKSGVSLLNNGRHGYDAKGATLRLTLLRSPHYPHPEDPAKSVDNRFTDQGEHSFSYALLPHAGDWRKGEVIRRAREFNAPLLIIEGRASRTLPTFVSSPSVNLQVEAIKRAEDSEHLIVRVREAHGETRDAQVKFGFPIREAFNCDLLEREIQKVKPTRTTLRLRFKPFEVKTLKVLLKPGFAKK